MGGRAFDEKAGFELDHPPQPRGLGTAEAPEDRNRRVYCQPCRDKGRTQMAHRVLPGGRGICNWCYRGEPHPDERKKPARPAVQTPAGAPVVAANGVKEEVKEEAMGRQKKLCACGCGEPAMKNRDYKRGHKPKGGGRKKPAVSSQPVGPVASPRKPNGGADAVQIPVAVLDRWFAELPAGKKAQVFAREVGA